MNRVLWLILLSLIIDSPISYANEKDIVSTVDGFSIVCGQPLFFDAKNYSVDSNTGIVQETVLFPGIESDSELTRDERNSVFGENLKEGFNVVASGFSPDESGVGGMVKITVVAPDLQEEPFEQTVYRFIQCPRGGVGSVSTTLKTFTSDYEKEVSINFEVSIDGPVLRIFDIEVVVKGNVVLPPIVLPPIIDLLILSD